MENNLPFLLQSGIFSALLLSASVIDIRKNIIHDTLCLGMAMAGLLTFKPIKLLGVLTAVIFLLVAIALGGTGGGDIKLIAAAGLVLSLKKCMAATVAGLTDMLLFHAIYSIIRKQRGGDASKAYPLAPFLSLGCLAAYLLFKGGNIL